VKQVFSENLDKSGKMFRKKYLEQNYQDILNAIIKYSEINKLNELPFKQQVYHWYNDIDDEVLCYCGKKVKFKNSTIGYYEYCSKECMSSSNKTKEKRKKTNIEKFGTKTPAENKKIKEKIIKTNNDKYGHNSPLLNNNIKEKSKNTLQNNYNVLHPLQSEIIRDKMKKTNIDKYGVDNVRKNHEIEEKIFNTMMNKYGVKFALQNNEIKKKAKYNLNKTLSKKYLKFYPEYNIIKIDPIKKEYTMICEKGHEFTINYVLLNARRRTNTTICTKCNPINKSVSGLELEIISFIEENYNGEIITNCRNIIKKELDIYLPELKLAFEFNGLYWHSELYKDKNYHYDKTNYCIEKNINLFHIYEDDWIYKKNIIKSMILNKIKKIQYKIFARKCIIKEIKNIDIIRNFLETNHIQGFVGSKIKLGLFYNDNLVSLMTFGKNRLGIGKIKKYDYELLRFCNKLNTSVIGGASKLFNYFLKKYKPSSIVSYADRSYSNGNLYKILNFDLSHITTPSYHYVIDNVRKHRFNFRKSQIKGVGETEKEIMNNNNIFRIYNSGHMCFVYK